MNNQDNKEKKTFGEVMKKFFGTIGSWFRRVFLGTQKDMNVFDVEKIVSPGRKIVKNFFEKKLAVGALIIFLIIFAVVLIGPLFNPIDLSYMEPTQINARPCLTYLAVPGSLKNDAQSIAVAGKFSAGLSNEGEVFVWGDTRVSLQATVKDIPEELEDTKVFYLAAGTNHCIAITEEGKIVGWGVDDNGQYGKNGLTDPSKKLLYTFIPDELEAGINVNDVKQLECGTQVTGLLMKDGTVYIWGNDKAGCSNIKKLNGRTDVEKIVFTQSAGILLLKDGTVFFGDNTSYNKIDVDNTGKPVNSSTPQANLPSTVIPLEDYIGTRKVLDIAAASSSVLLKLDDGELVVAGSPSAGKFDKTNEKDIPTNINGNNVVAMDGGISNFVVLLNDGTVRTWGGNSLKQSTLPKSIQGKNIVSVSSGCFQNYAIDDEGHVYTWGLKGYAMGTDHQGRDVWNRILNGGKMTMTIGAVSVIISSIIGIVIGVLSGYFGGWVDIFLMRVTEVFSAIPFLPFALILSAVVQQLGIPEKTRILLIMVILGVLSWTGLARLVRGQVLAEREKEFVLAAKAIGVKESRIAFKHILPNVISIILVNMTLNFAGCMLTESGLSYLGFGVQPPRPTWGNMLNGSNNSVVIQEYWWRWVFPAIFLGICCICINIIGDTLRDVMDPKTTER